MERSTTSSRPARLLGLAALAFWLVATALPAAAKTVTYVPDAISSLGAYVVEWRSGGRSRTIDWRGAQTGTVTDDGTQKLITLDAPLAHVSYSIDVGCDGWQYRQRYETHQIVFRQVEGTANIGKTDVVEIGVVVDVDGCTPGRTVPFGGPGDAGQRWLHRGYGSRTPMTDVQAGFSIAGFFESLSGAGQIRTAADIVTLDTPTRLRFHTTGTVVDAAFNTEQWLVLQMPSVQHGYTRLSVHGPSTTETWLVGKFVGGKLQTVQQAKMVKPIAGTSFGSLGQTARMWESWVGMGTNNPFFVYLYRNFSGERVSKDLALGTESRSPIAWRYEGANIVQTRSGGIERTWVPLASSGSYRVVMEQEWLVPIVGTPTLRIAPRVMYYRNTGVATPPP